MENASKALLMAGGVLIAVLIIGLVIYVFNTSSQWNKTAEDIKQVEQITAFNMQYESYNKKLLRGAEVISVINKALDNNEKYGVNGYNEPDYKMTVTFRIKEELAYLKDGSKKKFFIIDRDYNQDEFKVIKNDAEAFTDFKRRIFDCISITYSNKTGRVDSMHFIERKLDNYEEGL